MNTKIKIVSFSNQPENPGLFQLRRSLDFFGYDYHIIEDKPYIWFGTKIIETYNYVKTIQDEYTHFIFVDAHDVVFLRGLYQNQYTFPPNFFDQNFFSAEKACWPDSSLADKYPNNGSDWKYLNSGSYSFNIKEFIKMVDDNTVVHKEDDQLWFTNRFLENKYNIVLDYGSIVFQSIAFENTTADVPDFFYDSTTLRNKYGAFPFIIHANGGTDMSRIYQILDNIINQDNELA